MDVRGRSGILLVAGNQRDGLIPGRHFGEKSMFSDTIWELKSSPGKHIDELARELNISRLLAGLLLQRGVSSAAEAAKFLRGTLDDLGSPWSMSGMQEACQRIMEAKDRGEKIIVYGDYDVDGVCSVVILLNCLRALGCATGYYIPDRFREGYGLNSEAVRQLAREYRLLISVDCGINSVEEIDVAGQLGMDVIVADHHTPGGQLPAAAAIINPKLDDYSDSRELCGAGIAYQLARALGEKRLPESVYSGWLALAALATVADVVPLRGDNRIIVKEGLKVINGSCPAGIKTLLRASGMEDHNVDAWHLAFVLAPRLNAAGRLANARLSVELLMHQDSEASRDAAQHLCRLNDERKALEEVILNEAAAIIAMEDDGSAPAIVLAAENWHHGVLGITASRLCERYCKPVLMIGWEGQAGRGSARSLTGYNIFEALWASRQSLIRFGGHSMAAGFSVARDKFAVFKEAVLSWAERIRRDNPQLGKKRVLIDAELDPEDINEQLMAELHLLKPFGERNPEPVFVVRSTELKSPFLMGKAKEHFKALLPGQDIECIAFNRSDFIKLPHQERMADLVGSVKENHFRGRRIIQFKLLDARASLHPGDYRLDEARHPREALLRDIAGCLKQKHGVIIVFPTLRLLQRGRIWLEGFFYPGMLGELHGAVDPDERTNLTEAIKNGNSRIYLSTHAFMQHHSELQRVSTVTVLDWPEIFLPGLAWRESEPVFDSCQPCLIYVNRPSTVKSLNARYRDLILEAGLSDSRLRRKAHRQFFNEYHAVMLSDGGCIKGVYNRRNVHEVYFADAPFSLHEAFLVAEHVGADGQPAGVGFSSREIKLNHRYLDRLFPDLPTVGCVWQAVQYFPPAVMEEEKAIAKAVSKEAGIPLSVLELNSSLRILQDLDLCRVQKKGSIMAIKIQKREFAPANLSKSAFYIEGQAEKAALASFEEKIKKALDW